MFEVSVENPGRQKEKVKSLLVPSLRQPVCGYKSQDLVGEDLHPQSFRQVCD